MVRGTTATPELLTMRSLRERQREERAALILDAARQVFSDKGFHEASIDEIATLAGVAKGTVYLHFASKEDLLAALVEQQILGFLAQVERAVSAALPVRARIEQIMLDVFSRMQEQRNQVLLDLNPSGLARRVLDRRPELQRQTSQARERIAQLIDEGQRSGELDRAVPAPVMVATLITLISPSGYESLLTGGQVTPAELAAYVSGSFFPSRRA